jgi:hypothetical protein
MDREPLTEHMIQRVLLPGEQLEWFGQLSLSLSICY